MMLLDLADEKVDFLLPYRSDKSCGNTLNDGSTGFIVALSSPVEEKFRLSSTDIVEKGVWILGFLFQQCQLTTINSYNVSVR